MRRWQVDHEATIDLQLGEWQLAKLEQRRIAGPEIVDCEADALDPKSGQRVHQLHELLRCAFGQLQHQTVRRHVHLAADALDEIRKVEALEADSRDVEGEAGLETLTAPYQPLTKRFAEAPLGQWID